MCVNSFSSGQLYEVYAVSTLILQMKFRNIKKSKFIAVVGRRDCNRFFGFGAVILNITIEAIDSQSVVPRQQHQHCLGTCWKCKFSTQPQASWIRISEQGAQLCSRNPPEDS